jgi:hypothetical protein
VEWRKFFEREPERGRMISLIWALGLILVLPIPEGLRGNDLLLVGLWIVALFNAYASGFWPEGRWLSHFLAFAMAFVYGVRTAYWIPTLLLVLILLWMRQRFARTKNLGLALLLTAALPMGWAETKKADDRKLDELASCGFLEKIPWEFRPDGFRTRRLFTETLQLSQDDKAYEWELHQTMNQKGEVTFIFRRKFDDRTLLSIAARDSSFVSALSRGRGSKTLQRQNVKDLLNRPALIFTRADTSSVSFMPGSMGKSTIMLQFAQADGRNLPPVYIRGNFCDRPATLDEGDLEEKTFGKKKKEGGILDDGK